MNFKLKVKNGDSTYDWDEKTQKYEFGKVDLVDRYDTLSAALVGFLEWVEDVEVGSKVSLSFVPEPKKGTKGTKGKK